MCEHKNVRFLHCTAGDRWPGVWECFDCKDTFNFDPSGQTSVRYLDKPNPEATKELPPITERLHKTSN